MRTALRLPLALVLLALVACGGGTEDAADTSSTTAVPSSAAPAATVAPPETTTTTAALPTVTVDDVAGCTISGVLDVGAEGDEVVCLEAHLADLGVFGGAPDTTFDDESAAAVRAFQEENGLDADGVVGRLTATEIGLWSEPPLPDPDPATCKAEGRSAVVDRDRQLAWLCTDGAIDEVMVMTSARTQPDPGEYEVYAKDMDAWSNLSGRKSTMTHFVAFTYGKYQGARIALHSMPKYEDGSWIQPLDTLGDPEWHGDSAGCIRVHPDDAAVVWDHLVVGDTVIVIS